MARCLPAGARGARPRGLPITQAADDLLPATTAGDWLGGIESYAANPLQDRLVLPACFVPFPALSAVVRGVVIGHVRTRVGGSCGLDKDQAVLRVVDVDHSHRVAVVFPAVGAREAALLIGRLQLEDDVVGVAHNARFA